jgi:Ca-activated chloride channel homolog
MLNLLMKKLLTIGFTIFCCQMGLAQYYLRGKVVNENNKGLVGASVYMHATKQAYKTDVDGSFGIISKNLQDSITVTYPGYVQQALLVKTSVWQTIMLKPADATVLKNKPKLISVTKDKESSVRYNAVFSDETYFQLIENEFIQTNKFPNTGFSLNVNKASYSNIRRFVNMKSKVPTDAVRVEEIINYFNLGYTEPIGKDVFNIKNSLTECPWNKNNKLLCLQLSAKKLDASKLPASNFVFLLDISGSMDMPNRLQLIKEAFQLFVKNLRPQDKVSIVTYGGMVRTWLAPTSGADKQTIIDRLEVLYAAGDTPGESGIDMAYKVAKNAFIPGGNNRIILATDGDFNVGSYSEKSLEELVTKYKETGIYLTCLGVGMGNYKDSKIQTLAKKGNGNYAYIDNLKEAEKVLVQELTETLYTVADNASINIEFNKTNVEKYRLIGFDNKRDALKDGSSEIDGGEIGSGSIATALFEIQLKNGLDPSENIAKYQLNYHVGKEPANKIEKVENEIKLSNVEIDSPQAKLISLLALYGLKLKGSDYINKASWELVTQLASTCIDANNIIQKEFQNLVAATVAIYEPSKKKRK